MMRRLTPLQRRRLMIRRRRRRLALGAPRFKVHAQRLAAKRRAKARKRGLAGDPHIVKPGGRRRRLALGRRPGRFWPQRKIMARQANGLEPIPVYDETTGILEPEEDE